MLDVLTQLPEHFLELKKKGKSSDSDALTKLCADLISSSPAKMIQVICSLKNILADSTLISPILSDFVGFSASLEVLEKIGRSSVQQKVFVDFMNFIWNLPTRFANVNKGVLPMNLKQQSLMENLEKLACCLLRDRDAKKTCALLDLMFANVSQSKESALFLHEFAQIIIDDDGFAKDLAKNLRFRARRNFLESFINYCPPFSFQTLVFPLVDIFLAKNFNLLRICTGRLLNPNGQFHLGRIVALAGLEVWKPLVDYWADENILIKVSVGQRIQVSKIISFSVDYLPKCPDEMRLEIINTVSLGFKSHFAQSASDNRDIGMITAKKVISVFDSTAKLDFPITNKDLEADQNKTHEDSRERTMKFLNGVHKQSDKKIFTEDSDNDDDDDRESLDSDDLEFEQFEFETPNLSKYSPRFLLEASGILVEKNLPQSMSETEKTKRKLAALERIPYLAKVNQVSSKELVEEILKGITYFEIVDDNDAALVRDALESLAVVAPEVYAPAIVGEFYTESMSLEKRQIILASLSKAVKQLADDPFEELQEEIALQKLTLSAKVESQSRRWGSRPKSQKMLKSRFYPAAGYFLFPFLRSWDVNKRTLMFETNDKDVLSRMIAFVGQIISLLGNIPEIEKYVLPSIDFLATFRRLDDTNVKLVIIKSYQVCLLSIATTKQEIWMDNTWKMWLDECQLLDCPHLSIAATDLLNLF